MRYLLPLVFILAGCGREKPKQVKTVTMTRTVKTDTYTPPPPVKTTAVVSQTVTTDGKGREIDVSPLHKATIDPFLTGGKQLDIH